MDDNSSVSPGMIDPGWAAVGGLEYSIPVRTTYGLICLIGLIGNALVSFVLVRVKSIRTNTSRFLIHLSVVDIAVCLVALPLNIFPDPPPMHGRFGDFICRIYVSKYPQWSCMYASMGSLVLVNLERYIAIVHPLKYKSFFTRTNMIFLLIGVWLVSFATLWYFFVVFSFDEETGCQYRGWPSAAGRIVAGVYVYAVSYVGPLTFMFIAQWKMIAALKNQIKLFSQAQSGASANNRKLWQVKASQELQRTLLYVVITYAICWGPNQTMFFLFLMGVPVDFTQLPYNISVIMGVMNSCLNPVIYTARNKPFRDGLKKMMRCSKNGTVEPSLNSAGSSFQVSTVDTNN